MRRVLAWLALALVIVGALVYGVTDRAATSTTERAHNIGKTIMCPACCMPMWFALAMPSRVLFAWIWKLRAACPAWWRY